MPVINIALAEEMADRPQGLLSSAAVHQRKQANGGSFQSVEGTAEMGSAESDGAHCAAASRGTDRSKRDAEIILECTEDGDQVGTEEEGDEEDTGGRSASSSSSGSNANSSDLHNSSMSSIPESNTNDTEDIVEDDFDGGGNSAIYRRKPIKTRWSAVEDQKLKDAVDAHGSGNWKLVRFMMCRITLFSAFLGVWAPGE